MDELMESIQIINCKFKYECDQDWSAMEKTDDTYIRHCGYCKRNVHLVSIDSELDQAINNNWCVAVHNYPKIDFDLIKSEPWVCLKRDSHYIVRK